MVQKSLSLRDVSKKRRSNLANLRLLRSKLRLSLATTVVALTLLFISNLTFAKEPVIQVIYGEIIQADASANKVSVGVLSKNNSTQVYQMQLNQETRRIGFDQILHLKAGQKAEVDYFQNAQGVFIATRVELVKSREVPAKPEENEKLKKDSEDFHF